MSFESCDYTFPVGMHISFSYINSVRKDIGNNVRVGRKESRTENKKSDVAKSIA